jgi:hypothetical protein
METVDEAEHLPSNIAADYPKWMALWIMDKYVQVKLMLS